MDATKNPNLETTHNNHTTPLTSSPSQTSQSAQGFKRTHEELCVKQLQQPSDDHSLEQEQEQEQAEAATKMESGREKLKRHRVEMSGRVWIPDIWGQEDLLKKWIDSTVFDSSVEKSSIMSARDALIQEGRTTLSIENSC